MIWWYDDPMIDDMPKIWQDDDEDAILVCLFLSRHWVVALAGLLVWSQLGQLNTQHCDTITNNAALVANHNSALLAHNAALVASAANHNVALLALLWVQCIPHALQVAFKFGQNLHCFGYKLQWKAPLQIFNCTVGWFGYKLHWKLNIKMEIKKFKLWVASLCAVDQHCPRGSQFRQAAKCQTLHISNNVFEHCITVKLHSKVLHLKVQRIVTLPIVWHCTAKPEEQLTSKWSSVKKR